MCVYELNEPGLFLTVHRSSDSHQEVVKGEQKGHTVKI